MVGGGPILKGFPSPWRLRRSLSRRYFQRSAERAGVIGGRVDLYLDQQHIDTTTPTGHLLHPITGAFAEFERSIVRSGINLGLARARSQGKRLGRRPVSENVVERIREQLATGAGILKTAKELGCGTGTVHRVKRSTAAVAA